MLKKFLTTIIVLAATATAWADGWSVTYDTDNCHDATITKSADGTMTLADAIAEVNSKTKEEYGNFVYVQKVIIVAESMTEEEVTALGAITQNHVDLSSAKGMTNFSTLPECVKYVILPDGMTKEQVNAVGSEFDAVVSMSEATKTETKWVYTYNDEEFIYEGTPTTIDGVSKANVTVFVPLTVTDSSYKLGDSDYSGTVFYDSNGNCYGVQNESSDIFNLTSAKGYTYNNGATEYTGKVAESEGKYYGVINNPTEVALELNKSVSWTYENDKYAHLGKVYNNGTYIFYQGGTEYPLTTETRYTYDNGSKLYPENGLTRTADNKTYGWVGGTQVSLTMKNVWYNGTTVYDGPVREADGVTYGGNWWNGPFEIEQLSGYTYNNGTTSYTGAVRTVVADGNTQYYGNTGSGEIVVTSATRKVYKDNYNSTQLYGEDKPTRTAKGITYGNTGTQFDLIYYKDAYTYKLNSWSDDMAFYEGATRTDNGTIYGNTGEQYKLLTTETAPYTYDNGKYIYGGEYISGTTGNNGGEFYELQMRNSTAEEPLYTYVKTDASTNWVSVKLLYTGEVTDLNGQWPYYEGTVNDQTVNLEKLAAGSYYFYSKGDDGLLYYYNGNVYTKLDDTGTYGCVGGTEVIVAEQTDNVDYYVNASNIKVVYTGNKYYSQTNPEEAWAVVDSGKDVALTKQDVYTKADGTIYTGKVYEFDANYYGFENGSEVVVTEETVYLKEDETLFTGNVYDKTTDGGTIVKVGYTNSYEVTLAYGTYYRKVSDGTVYTGTVYHKQGDATAYMGGNCNEFNATSGTAWFYTPDGGVETQYTAGVYTTADDKNVGFVGGEEKELTHGEVKYYTKDEQTVIATDNTRISLDGDTYCDGGNAIVLTNKEEGYTANLYKDGEGRSVIYTGKVYGDATGYIGGTETELAYGDIYKKEDGTIYTGYRNEDNTKGCNNAQTLTTSFTYAYTDPNNGETATFTDTYHFTTKEVDYTATVEQKEIEMPTGKVHLTAYVSAPGSLKFALVRWKDLGNNNAYAAQVGNVTALTLSGDVNYADIGTTRNTITEYGHVAYTDNGNSVTPEGQGHERNIQNDAPAMDGNALTYLDLENAVFAVQTDMQFAKVSNNLVTVILPTDKSMTLIPDHAFDNLQQVSELCIPYNYTTIGSCAFYNTHALMHIYTTDNPEVDSDDETIVDNGPYTYTFSANLKQIEGGIGVNSTFFGNHIEDVTDIYVLAEEAPLCGANAFAGSMTYGNNGFAGNWTHPICRENYINSNKWICVLHYPSSSTDEQAAKYTDITRNYTLIDEVGNVDGDGRPIAWPRHAEFYRAYNQAINGYIWYDWKEYAEGATEVIQIYDASNVSANPTKYDQAYQGWHEFVLVGNSRSRDFDPQKENREYIQRDWYTICVPYDLTKSQLLNMLGVVNSEDDETVYALEENEGKWEVSETGTAVTQNLYPDVRALTHVSRDINENGTYVSGKVTLHLSEPLISVDENGNVTCSHVDINEDGQGYTHATLEGDDPIVMEGGHAYLIRPYVPKEWNDQIKNLGMYIMAMADSYNNAAVSAGLPAPYSYNEDCKFENKVYLPCFKHKIHAVKGNVSPNASARNIPEFVYEDAEGQSPAYYRFVGTYTQTTVPQYAYYLGKNKTTGAHQFFRTTKETTKWNPYSAVIVGLSSNPNYTGVDTSGQTGIQSVGFVSDNENDLRALAGEVTNPSNAGKSLSFEQLMGDANGEATGIVDVNVSESVNVSNNKVYSINGQYMGTSLNKLPKGIYIINGQKKVVK